MTTSLWDIYCGTESKFYKYVNSNTQPTECPTNSQHTIISVRASDRASLQEDNSIIEGESTIPIPGIYRLYVINGKLYLKNASNINKMISNDNDKKMVSSTVSTSTTSDSYTDLADMSLTTSGTTTRNYTVHFTATCNMQNGTISYVLNVGGSVINDSLRYVVISSGDIHNIALSYITTPISSGTIIKIQWKTSTNKSATTFNRGLIIEGDASDDPCARTII